MHWQLDAAYVQWLNGMQGVEKRGDRYYTSQAGQPLEALPKVRTGSQPQRGGRGGGGRGGRQGRGRGRQEQQQQRRDGA